MSPKLFAVFFCLIGNIASAQNIDSVLQAHSDQTVAKKIRVLDDLAWDNMYTNYSHALRYGLAANKLALDSGLRKSTGTTYNTLGVVCRRQGLYERSKYYYRQADAVWKELGIVKEQININLNLANVVRAQGFNDSALFYGNKGLEIALELKDSIKISAVIVGLGTTYKNMGWDATAIDYYTKGAEIDQALGDTIGLGIYWSNIGDVLFKLKDFDEALHYYRETLKVDKYDNNKLNQSITYKSIGMTFHKLGMTDSALYSYDRGLQLATEIGDELMVADISTSKAQLLSEAGQRSTAEDLLQSAIEIAKSYEDPLLQSSAALGLGDHYLSAESLDKATLHLTNANEISGEIGYGAVLLESYKKLAEAYSRTGQNQFAFNSLQKYVELNDSLNSASTQARIAELENKYELSNKDHQIELQASVIQRGELQLERNRAIGGIIILSLVTLLAAVLWFFKRKQYKTQLHHESERNQMKEEQIRAVIKSQEKERKRFAMDLHDDFGQLISALKLNVSKVKEASINQKSGEILDSMYSSLKNIAFDLMPHTLFEKGLEEAIDELCSQVNASGNIRMSFQSFEIQDKIDGEQKVAVYRIVQEIVSNILKYANARKINISVTDLGEGLTLLIEDDGQGFDVESFKHSKGNGWKNIQSRLNLMHGEIEFDTVKGRANTTISIEIPYLQKEVIAA